MKRIITTLFLLHSSISSSMQQTENTFPYNSAYFSSEHVHIRCLIRKKNTEELTSIKRDGKLTWRGRNYWLALENIGVSYAAYIGAADICKFLLDLGVSIGDENPLVCAKYTRVIQTIFSNCIVRPSNYELDSAFQGNITFLLCARRICPLLPKDIRIKILAEAGFFGDLMIKRLLKGQPIRKEFFAQSQNRLLTTTFEALNCLRNQALTVNPSIEIPNPREFKDEILRTIAKRMTIKPFLCNGRFPEPKNEVSCIIY